MGLSQQQINDVAQGVYRDLTRSTSKRNIEGMLQACAYFANAQIPYMSHENEAVAETAIAHIQVGHYIKTGELFPASAYRNVLQAPNVISPKLEALQ